MVKIPTGYTADVGDGKVTELKDFAADCARGFMPFIHMRDDDPDAPLRFPSHPGEGYEFSSLQDARKEVAEWRSATEEDKYAQWSKYVNDKTLSQNQALRGKAETEANYRAMLDKVLAIDAPSNVQSFKDFLISQLEESIKFDCSTTYLDKKPLSYSEWCDFRTREVQRSVEYFEKRYVEALERYDKQCDFIQAYADTFGFEVPGDRVSS